MTTARIALRSVLALIVVSLLAVASCRTSDPPKPDDGAEAIPPTSLALTDQNFDQEVLQSEKIVVVDFWAVWCAPCRHLTPIVNDLAKDYEGRVKICNLNIDEQPKIPVKYKVETLPTLLFFRDGKVLGKMWGVQPKAVIAAKLDELLAEKKAAS